MQTQANDALRLMTGAAPATCEELMASPLGTFVAEKAEIVFQPIFFANNRIIAGHGAELVHDGAKLTPQSDVLAQFGRPQDEAAAIIDIFTHSGTLAFLGRSKLDTPSLAMCPVHLSTVLRARYRSAFLEAEVPDIHRELLVLRVRSFSQPFSRMKISDAGGYLRHRARGLVAEIALGGDDLSVFKQAGFQAIGVDLTDDPGLKSAFLKQGRDLSARAKKCGLRSFVMGADKKDVVAAALEAECSYIGGAWFSNG
jgi:hypothetical protein